MEKMVLKLNVPTSQRVTYYTGMTTEMLQSVEVPPAKGIWPQNHDRLLKVCCQMERMNSFTPEEEFEQTADEQVNIKVGKQGVIMDDNDHQEVNEMFNELTTGRSVENVEVDEEEQFWTDTSPKPSRPSSPPIPVQDLKLDDQSINSSAPYFEESLAPCTAKDNAKAFRKQGQFNGRPFADWGNLFPPLKASAILPLPPMTGKLWWQIATDQVPVDSATTGQPSVSFNNKVKKFMKPHFDSQIWNTEVMEQVSACRTSCMHAADLKNLRETRAKGYAIKFPKSTTMINTATHKRTTGESLNYQNFNQSRHQNYAARSERNTNFQRLVTCMLHFEIISFFHKIIHFKSKL